MALSAHFAVQSEYASVCLDRHISLILFATDIIVTLSLVLRAAYKHTPHLASSETR